MNLKQMKQPGLRARALRLRHNCSQDELSSLLKLYHAPISRDIIANWESGRSEVPAHLIPVIAHALHAAVADILPDLTLKELVGLIGPKRRRSRRKP